ncbi:MAG: Mov34/MPN/PAD-1 family protein [Bryobacteraceae bacterium]
MKSSSRPDRLPMSAGDGNGETAIVPELTYHVGCDEVKVTISGQACQALIGHCGGSNLHGHEVGGILVGYRYERTATAAGAVRHYVMVTDVIPVESQDSSERHLRFDEDTWEWVERQMTDRFTPEGKCRLGWYHTHPSQGIFFSGQDRDAHTVFQQHYQLALVIDPRVMEAGLFYWADYDERTLVGPLCFGLTEPSLQLPATRPAAVPREPLAPVDDGPSKPKLDGVRCAAFAVLAGLFAGFLAGRFGHWLPPGLACALAALVLVGLRLWTLGFFHRRVRILRSTVERFGVQAVRRIRRKVYAGVLACAGVVPAVFFAVHFAARQVPIAVAPTVGASKTSAPQPTLASAPRVTQSPITATISSETIRLFVSEDRRRHQAGSFRVVLESRLPAVRVTYSIRDCPAVRRESALASCTISNPGAEEERFFSLIFHWRCFRAEPDSLKALQAAVGLPDPQDGHWGSRTRAAWLEWAVKPRQGPLHISLPGPESATVVFEKE